MKSLFVCYTEYQVFNAISIVKERKNERVELFLINPNKIMIDIVSAKEVKESFQNIELLKVNIPNGVKSTIINKFTKKVNKFEYLFIANINTFTNLLFNSLYKVNNKIKVILFEDGLGSYIRKIEGVSQYRKKIFILMTGKRIISNNDIESLYIRDKALLSYTVNKKINIEEFSYIQDILMFKKYILKGKNNIFFDQPFTVDNIKIDEIDLLDKVSKVTGEILLKYHPRQKKKLYSSLELIKELKNIKMWEFEANNPSIESCNLITVNSTAVFIPTLLYGYKPKIIILNKLVLKENPDLNIKWMETFNIFLEKFKGKYGDIVFEPESYNELGEILREGKKDSEQIK